MAALDFPSSPTLNQTYSANGLIWYWDGVSWITQNGYPTSALYFGTTAPSSPTAGNMWWKSDEGRLKIYYADANTSQWVDAYPALAGPNQITSATLSGLTGFLLGSGGYVTTTTDLQWSETYKQLSVGGSSWVSAMMSVGGTTPTTSTFSEAFVVAPTLHAACTSGSHIMSWLYTEPATALTSHTHYMARQGTLGAGTTITTQYGYIASSTLTGATTNYGFYSALASGTGRWNFYANGTAPNYFAGQVGIGTPPTSTTAALTVSNIPGKWSASFTNNLNGAVTPPNYVGLHIGYNRSGTDSETNICWGTAGGANAALIFASYDSSNYVERMRIAANGAVTLATALPVGSGGTGATTAAGALNNIGAAGVPTDIWGDGSDGNVTVSTSVTLTKDMYYNNLTLSTGAAINTNGFRIFVAGILDISAAPVGAITSNGGAGGAGGTGGNASGGSAGAVGTWGGTNFLVGPSQSIVGKVGGLNNTPTAPLNGNSNYQLANPVSYAGASGGGNGALANNGATAYTGQRTLFTSGFFVWAGLPDTSQMSNITVTGGAVGGGGGASGSAFSGGGGGGGPGGCAGQVVIVAKTIARGTNTTAGIIRATGGAGGVGGNGYTSGTAGGGGGGQGGHGGYVTIIYNAFTGSTIANAINVSGGAGGKGGNGVGWWGGGGGASGASGVVSITQYPAMTNTYYEYTAGSAGSAPSTTTGGNGAATNTRTVAL